MSEELLSQAVKGYELREQIGEGGYGMVYRAYQASVGRDVAVKIILPQHANHPEFIRRFESEAQLVARLEHPAIVPLYDYWREPSGAYLIMRWLRGGSLHTALHQEPLPAAQLMRLLDQIGGALTTAHRRGVIHRDLKPANILLDEDGNAYLADFGIAKDLGERTSPYQTDQTRVVGSPAYISPEQVRAQPITPQTDIYSMGVMLYEILTGKLPFAGATPLALMFKHVSEPMPPITVHRPDLLPAVNAVLQKATAKRPSERYADVLSMLAEFKQALGLTPLATAWPPYGAERPTPSPGARRSTYETGIIELPALEHEPETLPYLNPYKGLRAFQEADTNDFFGRETLVEALLERMRETGEFSRFLAVVGPSGSGKSSVVRAGLIPALKQGALHGSERWYVVELFPGSNPVENLAQALLSIAVNPPTNLTQELSHNPRGLLHTIKQILPGDSSTEVVLVIDQFEELFTLVDDEAQRRHFMNMLLSAASDRTSRLRVVATLRADFYDRPLLYPGFSTMMRERTELVMPMVADELKEAIVQPALQAGLRAEPELVEAIVADVDEQPGALPLLQYALTELFERRQGRLLTLASYQASGGVLGALARRAEDLYSEMNTAQQAVTRQIFLRLVTLGEGVEDTRRRVRRSELTTIASAPGTGAAPIDAVLDLYSQYRLLTGDRDQITRTPTVEVAHEALIRTWERLRSWLDASRDDVRQQRRLGAAAAEWAASGRERSFLASGARLTQLETWAAETHLALNTEERAYMDASLSERDTQNIAELVRAQREQALEQRSKTFLRALVGMASAAAVLGLLLAAFAFSQRSRAEQNAAQAEQSANEARKQKNIAEQNAAAARDQKARAEQSANEARNLTLAADAQAALSEGNTDLALALALSANQASTPTNAAQLALAQAAYAPGTRKLLTGHSGPVMSVAVSPDGTQALSASRDNTIILWDLKTGTRLRTLEGHTDDVFTIAWSHSGRLAVSGAKDDTMILWEVATWKPIGEPLRGHKGDVFAAVFSPDDSKIISASNDHTLMIWDVATRKPLRQLAGHSQEVKAVAFSPDGMRAVSGSADQTLILWDVASGKQIGQPFKGHAETVQSVAFSPDGSSILSGSSDTTLILWDAATGAIISRMRGHTREVWSIAFSPDGKQALSGSRDGRIGVWNIATGQPLFFLRGHGADIQSVTFLPDGKSVLSGSFDNTLRLWDLTNGAAIRTFVGHVDRVNRVVLSRDGTRALSSSGDRSIIIWDVATGKPLYSLNGHNDAIGSLALRADEQMAASGANERDGTIILWDLTTRNVLKVLNKDKSVHTKEISALAFSPDGSMLLSGSGNDGSDSKNTNLALWDVASGTMIRAFKGHTAKVYAVAFTPNGQLALSASADKTVIIWDVATGKPLQTLKGHTSSIRALAVDATGTRALSGSDDKVLILWDIASGRALQRLVGHTSSIWDVAFSPDGTQALSGSDDGYILLWNLSSGEIVRRYTGHTASVRAVAFTSDGRSAISASNDKTLMLWRVDAHAELVQWILTHRYQPQLTCDQIRQYQLEQPCS
ncbi:MAG: protein kinase [Chloroflexi bacterium SZAS-1]|nr:protein kinase [Chloroflexi bacterium SZAS-1]